MRGNLITNLFTEVTNADLTTTSFTFDQWNANVSMCIWWIAVIQKAVSAFENLFIMSEQMQNQFLNRFSFSGTMPTFIVPCQTLDIVPVQMLKKFRLVFNACVAGQAKTSPFNLCEFNEHKKYKIVWKCMINGKDHQREKLSNLIAIF